MPEFPTDAHIRGGQVAAVSNREFAREFYAPILPLVRALHHQGR